MNRSIISLTVLLVLLSFGTMAAFAGSVSFSGTFSSSDPTMNLISISTPNCTFQNPFPVRYDAYRFTVTETGAYNFSVASTGDSLTFASIYIMDSGFNPAAALGNCIAASNNGDSSVAVPTTLDNVNLTAGTPYYLVIFDDTGDQTTPGYTGSADGVGDILIEGSASANLCSNPLPAGSVVYSVPAGAPAFYAADLATKVNFNLPAGTWWISEFTGDFAKVWMSCQATPFYIPSNAVAH
ncbi:MAG: hypothetical protein ABI835_18395 [Chloroflexota bacterium]